MPFENWDEIRTAYQVARLGTVSGAAEVLGVHHATVIRHVDALEARLGTKLFQRHARGYTATEAGTALLTVAQATDEQFAQLAARLAGAGAAMTGELIVTSLAGLSPIITPVLAELQAAHPELVIRYLTDARLFRLEYGEAHVAIRAGVRPQEPDNVVQPLGRWPFGLFAARELVESQKLPMSEADLADQRFVSSDDAESRAPFDRWLAARVPRARMVFRSNDPEARTAAVRAGVGLGFLSQRSSGDEAGLVQVMPPEPDWQIEMWLVTHVDLHRSAKVQAFLEAAKRLARSGAAEG